MAALTFLERELGFGFATVGFSYLILIMLLALLGSFAGSILVSLVAAGCLDYFFAPSLFSSADVAALAAFLTTSVVVSGLTAKLRMSSREREMDQKRMIDALRQREEQWREVFEHTPTMYFMLDGAGTVLSVNAFGAAQLGYAVEELVGESVLKVFFAGDRERAKAHLAICLKALGEQHKWELRKIRKDGTLLWVRENAKAVQRSGDDLIVLVACEDITDRKRGEQRLAAQYAVTRTLAESDGLSEAALPILRAICENLEWDWGALWTVDCDGARLHCEHLWHASIIDTTEFDRVSRGLSLTAEQGRVVHVWRSARPIWMSDATIEPDFSRASVAARVGLRGSVAFPILLGGKALGVVEFFSHAVRDPDQEQLATLSVVGSQIGQFISRKRAEQALQERENHFRALIEHSSDVVLLLDARGFVRYASPSLTRVLGYSPDDLVGRDALDLVRPDQLEKAKARFAQFIAQAGNVVVGERLVRHKDGTWRWSESVISNLLHEPGVRAVALHLRDISERKRAEEALAQARAELAHMARLTSLGELAASIAHEVNQPLTAVVTDAGASLRWLAAQTPNLAEARHALKRIIKDGHRAGEVIGRIRALAKKSPIQADRLKVNEIIRGVIALTRSELQRNQVVLRTELADELPVVLADRIQLQQVILNLIVNAIEAMVDGAPRELVVTSAMDSSEHVLVAVRDSGTGLDPEAADRLFEAFYTTKPAGMGMGLAISRSIIEAHGGRLWASANSPRGAVFQFTLPVRQERAADVVPSPRAAVDTS